VKPGLGAGASGFERDGVSVLGAQIDKAMILKDIFLMYWIIPSSVDFVYSMLRGMVEKNS